MTFSVWGSFGANVPTRDVFATETFTTLRALTPPPATLNVSIEVDGGAIKGDGSGGIFYYDPNSILIDDSVNVIAPTPIPAAGRWIRRDLAVGVNSFRRNAIINGGMEIAQRGTNFPAIVNGSYSLDRWRYNKGGTMVHTLSQDNDVPTILQAGQLYLNSLRANLTTSQAIIAPGDVCTISQTLEGYNWRGLAQRPTVLSFWVKATLPGIYSVGFRNSVGDQSLSKEYTINLANTWEKKIINVPSSPSIGGTWNYTNGTGLILDFPLAVGINLQTPPNVWTAASAIASPNQINGVQAGAIDFRITGVQLEAGSLASEFERRTIQEELALCQRYYQTRGGEATFEKLASGGIATATHATFTYPYLGLMRIPPILSLSNVADFAVLTRGAQQLATVIVLESPTIKLAALQIDVAAGLTPGDGAILQTSGTLNARFNLSSEF